MICYPTLPSGSSGGGGGGVWMVSIELAPLHTLLAVASYTPNQSMVILINNNNTNEQ
jgi:hypothetical protein